jgi:hypothetical protein
VRQGKPVLWVHALLFAAVYEPEIDGAEVERMLYAGINLDEVLAWAA